MDLAEATPLLTENHTAVVSTLTSKGRVQSTVVTTGLVDGKLCWASRGHTVKVRNVERNGRATATVIKLDTRRYVTVEGPATVHHWPKGDPSEHLKLLKEVYTAMGRAPNSDEEFAKAMAGEQRSVIMVTPERVYGSLTQR